MGRFLDCSEGSASRPQEQVITCVKKLSPIKGGGGDAGGVLCSGCASEHEMGKPPFLGHQNMTKGLSRVWRRLTVPKVLRPFVRRGVQSQTEGPWKEAGCGSRPKVPFWGWLPVHCCLFRRLSGCSPGHRGFNP